MEALTGVSVAALTIYDMCKAVNKSIVIESIRLEEKRGGKSDYVNKMSSQKFIHIDVISKLFIV